MARVSVATPGRSVTTYQSGKKDSASRRPRSALKNIIIKPSLKVKQTSASRAIKNRKAVTEASSQSDECSTDGSGSGDSGSDEAKGQEEEFDPELRSLVYKSGLKAGQFKARPHKDTPTVSRTHVSRYRESVLVARSPTGSKTMLQTTRIGEDEDTDSGSTSTSGDDDGDDDRELDRVVKARSIIRVGGGHVAKEGKESVPTRNNAGALAKDREQGRRFGKDFALAVEPRMTVRKRPYETASRHIQQASKIHGLSRPQPVYARVRSRHKTRVYELSSSDTEAMDSNDDQHVFGIQEEKGVQMHHRDHVPRQIKHQDEVPRESRVFEEAHSRTRDYEHLRPEMAPAWSALKNVFHDINEKMRIHKNKVNEAIVEELEPMHKEAEKVYNHLAGHQTEKMISQQNLMENALNEHYETLHSAKRRVSSERKRLQEAFLQLKERYDKLQESRDEALTRAKKMVEELEGTQAQDAEGPKEEWRQVIEKAKAKAEKLLDPAVLSAKFAKQRKYIFQEVGI